MFEQLKIHQVKWEKEDRNNCEAKLPKVRRKLWKKEQDKLWAVWRSWQSHHR